MQNSNQFFATAKPLRLFFRVAVPGLISMLAMSLYIAFEGIFVGHMIGDGAFAAVNVGFPIVMINSALADLIGVGSSVPIAIALGQKDEKRACNVFTCSILLIFMTAVATGILIFFAAPLFVSLMNATGELATLAVKYVRVYALMGPLTTVVFAVDNYLRISGFVKGSMLLNIFMSLLTVGFLALFLVVLRMNVEGAALASCLAMFICACIAFIPFLLKRSVLKFVKPKFSFALVKEIVACGTPVFLNNVAGRVTSILLNATLITLGHELYGDDGTIAVATYSVLMYVSAIVEPMLYGMCDSIQPAVGYNWGAGKLDRVAGITKVAFTVCALVSVLCAGMTFLFPEALVSVFVDATESPEVVGLALQAMPYFGLALLLGWFCFAVQGFFAAIAKPLFATVVSVSYAIVTPVLLLYALMPMGLDGVWLNYFGRALLTGVVAVVLIVVAQKRMKKEIAKYQTPTEEELSSAVV